MSSTTLLVGGPASIDGTRMVVRDEQERDLFVAEWIPMPDLRVTRNIPPNSVVMVKHHHYTRRTWRVADRAPPSRPLEASYRELHFHAHDSLDDYDALQTLLNGYNPASMIARNLMDAAYE